MSDIAALVANNLDIWTGAIERKSGAGRGGGSKRISLYGIERLRALILNLAVRGKLVPQDSAEGSAEELLRKIRKERAAAKLVGKSLKAGDGVDRSLFSEAKTPQGWATVSLSDVILRNVGGGTPSKAEPSYWGGDIPWASVKDIGKSKFVSDTQDRITELGLAKSSANLVPAGNIILVTRMGLGQLSINTIDLAINQDLRAIFLSKYVDIDYSYNYFLTCEIEGAGMTVKGIKLDDLLGLPFPLPPLAEQRRIVAKVDELMALCDELERESADALAAHQTLVETLLATLVNSVDAADLAANWARLESHFDALFTTEASIDALKQTILDLAVRGKLMEQKVVDGAASDLLKRIEASNAKRVAAGDAKKMRSQSDTPSGLSPFDVPTSWVWTSLDRIAYKITDGAHHTPTYTDEGVPFLSVKDMSSGKLDFSDTRFISAEQHAELYRRCDPEAGDLLITKVGTTGVPVIVDTDQPFSLFVSVALVKAPWDLISVEYLRLLVDSPFVRRQSAEGTQGIGNKNLVLRTIGAFQIPLPPLAEQKRIVTKVDELMALCDAFRARLADAAGTRRHLADAIVERAAA